VLTPATGRDGSLGAAARAMSEKFLRWPARRNGARKVPHVVRPTFRRGCHLAQPRSLRSARPQPNNTGRVRLRTGHLQMRGRAQPRTEGPSRPFRPTHHRLYVKRVTLAYLVATRSGCSMACYPERGSVPAYACRREQLWATRKSSGVSNYRRNGGYSSVRSLISALRRATSSSRSPMT
jgi:hypothetical protein